jgi:hypothetical protein
MGGAAFAAVAITTSAARKRLRIITRPDAPADGPWSDAIPFGRLAG